MTECQGAIRDILEQLQKGIGKVSEKVETLNAFCASKEEEKFQDNTDEVKSKIVNVSKKLNI